jgi:hypothetical protein
MMNPAGNNSGALLFTILRFTVVTRAARFAEIPMRLIPVMRGARIHFQRHGEGDGRLGAPFHNVRHGLDRGVDLRRRLDNVGADSI